MSAQPESLPVVQLVGVSKAYGPVQALEDVSLDLHRGQVQCLAGENGAGKSTLIKVLTGAIRRDGGAYLIDGHEVGHPSPAQARALGIGVVYQELSLLPDLSVAENLLMGRLPARSGVIRSSELKATAARLLERVGLGALDPQTLVADLPVATRQRVEIARVLGAQARVVIFDEPTTALADEEAQQLMHLIRQLRSEGVAILYITHRLEEIFAIGDRITVLRDGRVVTTAPATQFDHDGLIRAMLGRQIDALYPGRQDKQPGKTLLAVRGLQVRGSAHPVTFEVHAGEIVGLAGLVGTCRSETVRAILGADPIEEGTIEVDGTSLHSGSSRQIVHAGLGLLTEDREEQGLLLDLSMRENVAIVRVCTLARLGIVSGKQKSATLDRLLPGLRVKFHSHDQAVSRLSGGNSQKVLLARWLAANAKVLLFDEPTSGVDVGAQVAIYALIRDLATRGLGIVVVSSSLPELLGICDRVLVVRDVGIAGELVSKDATEEEVRRPVSGAPISADQQQEGGSDVMHSCLAHPTENALAQEQQVAPPEAAQAGTISWRASLGRELGSFLILLLLVAALSLSTSHFLTATNLTNLTRQVAVFAILSLAELFVILTAGIDLSVGSVLALCGASTAQALVAGIPVPLAIGIGLIVGLIVGLANGLLVACIRLPPFMATLGMLGIARGLVLLITQTRTISPLPDAFNAIARNSFLGLPNVLWMLVVIGMVATFVLSRTVLGRYIYAVGSNPESARLSRVPVGLVLLAVYSISGLLAGFAGILTASRVGAGIPTVGTGYELQAIAMALIGGASLTGARGRALGAMVGALIMELLVNGGHLLSIDPFYVQIVSGALIIFAVYFNHLQAGR